MKAIILPLLSFIFLYSPLMGQGAASSDARIDSLEQALAVAEDDSSRSSLITMLFSASLDLDIEKARGYLERADQLLADGDCACCTVTRLGNWGLYYQIKGEYRQAEEQYLQAIEAHEQAGCPPNWAYGPYLNLGRLYQQLGELEKAIEYMSFSLKAAVGPKKEHYAMGAYNNLGIVYYQLGNFEQAGEYYRKALELAKVLGNEQQQASIQLNLGNIGFAQKDYTGALAAFEDALRMGLEMKDSLRLPSRYINVGLANYALGDFDRAMDHLRKGLEIAKSLKNIPQQSMAYQNMASVEASRGNYPKASQFLEESIRLNQQGGNVNNLLKGYRTLSDYYQKLGRLGDALEIKDRYTHLQDSLTKKRFESQMAAQLAEFEAVRLKAENDSIQNALLFSQQAGEIKDLKLARYWYLIAGLIGVLVLLGVVVVSVFRSNRLRSELRVAELKHTALLARMNPHFLFNALNSIQNAILNRDKKVAYAYHSQFSELMRMVLMHSDQKTVKLKEDLQALELYLQLEQLRTDNGFSYNIWVDPGLDPEVQEIPPMMLQPFVENAIVHGLLNRETPGKVEVRVSEENGFLKCVIEDNGVGRAEAERLRNLHKPGHTSVSTQLTHDRLELFRHRYGTRIGMEIRDLSSQGQASGTLVELLIPLDFSA